MQTPPRKTHSTGEERTSRVWLISVIDEAINSITNYWQAALDPLDLFRCKSCGSEMLIQIPGYCHLISLNGSCHSGPFRSILIRSPWLVIWTEATEDWVLPSRQINSYIRAWNNNETITELIAMQSVTLVIHQQQSKQFSQSELLLWFAISEWRSWGQNNLPAMEDPLCRVCVFICKYSSANIPILIRPTNQLREQQERSNQNMRLWIL